VRATEWDLRPLNTGTSYAWKEVSFYCGHGHAQEEYAAKKLKNKFPIVGSEDRVETNRLTDGRTKATALPASLMRSVKKDTERFRDGQVLYKCPDYLWIFRPNRPERFGLNGMARPSVRPPPNEIVTGVHSSVSDRVAP